MGCSDNGGMTETTADNRPDPIETAQTDSGVIGTDALDTDVIDTDPIDPLDRINAELDALSEIDPAEAVDVLADITAELNRELDADTDRS